jgi:hypothetical protein
MLFLQTLVVAFAAFFGVFARGSSDVVILSAENFDETVKLFFVVLILILDTTDSSRHW